jgi:hypothetical protein
MHLHAHLARFIDELKPEWQGAPGWDSNELRISVEGAVKILPRL